MSNIQEKNQVKKRERTIMNTRTKSHKGRKGRGKKGRKGNGASDINQYTIKRH